MKHLLKLVIFLALCLTLATSQQCSEQQPSVISGLKEHALYFTAIVKQGADSKALAKKAANLQSFVDQISPPSSSSPSDELIAGVGFGHDFYNGFSSENRTFQYVTRRGAHGVMPATGGDIFVHAKSNSLSKLFELTQRLLKEFGRQNLRSFEDVYGFQYKDGRDLSGFIDGTENPATPSHRFSVAVDCVHGGSFVLTQRWIHQMEKIEKMTDSHLENVIGRTKEDSIELEPLPATSHVSRMTTALNNTTAFEIVRQSMPYGTMSDQAGLFFISYANHTRNTDFMLDNMVAISNGAHNDMVMSISVAASGNYWFFPGVKELLSIKLL